MLKTQFPRVEHLSRESLCLRAVNSIAENRVTKMLKMDAHLMRPTTLQFAFDQTHFIR